MSKHSRIFRGAAGLAGITLIVCQPLPARSQDEIPAEQPLLSLNAINVSDILSNVRGGLKTGTRVLDKAELGLRFLGNRQHWPGVSAYLNLQWTDATAFSENLAGDLQNVSNLNGPAGFRVVNAWIAKTFEGQSGIKAGVIDLNSEFDVQTTGALFLNASHGIGPDFSQSGLNGPSIFPSYGLGLVGWGLAPGHFQWKAGIFEGTPGNPNNPGETSFSLRGGEGALLALEFRNRPMPNTIMGVGGWLYTAAFDTLEMGPSGPSRVHGNAGLYGLVEGVLYNPDGGDRAGLRGWMRAGIANAQVNPVDYYVGGGLVYDGPWGREADQIGFAVARAHIGGPARRAAAGSGISLRAVETTFEMTYSLALGGLATLQPDIQYVVSPGADRKVRDAVVIGTRMIFAWPAT